MPEVSLFQLLLLSRILIAKSEYMIVIIHCLTKICLMCVVFLLGKEALARLIQQNLSRSSTQ